MQATDNMNTKSNTRAATSSNEQLDYNIYNSLS